MGKDIYTAFIDSPLGWLKLTSDQTRLCSISFTDKAEKEGVEIPIVLKTTRQQLKEYFSGNRKTFDIPLNPSGTEFQKQVWNLVSAINFGETASYLEIAIQSGSNKNTRAVGLANGKNPIPIVIPCHRIIGTNGKLTGYAGGLERKRWLLKHEADHTTFKGRLF